MLETVMENQAVELLSSEAQSLWFGELSNLGSHISERFIIRASTLWEKNMGFQYVPIHQGKAFQTTRIHHMTWVLQTLSEQSPSSGWLAPDFHESRGPWFSWFMMVRFGWVPSGKLAVCNGKIHHFSWVNPLFLWPFSMAMLVYQRVYFPHGNCF